MLQDSELNNVYISALLPRQAMMTYMCLVDILKAWQVPYTLLENTKDIWCRDYMPIQITEGLFQPYWYYPDYLRRYKDTITNYRNVADVPTNYRISDIVLDGGNVVRCGSKVVMTAKVFEDNPRIRPVLLLDRLENVFDAEVIVLPWDRNEKFGHADGICRYVDKDTILLTNYRQYDREMDRRFRACLKPHFKRVVELKFKPQDNGPYTWAYINWLQTDKVIIVPAFGCEADFEAIRQIEAVMPSYKGRVVPCYCPEVVKDGGGLNCCTWTTWENGAWYEQNQLREKKLVGWGF